MNSGFARQIADVTGVRALPLTGVCTTALLMKRARILSF